MNVTETEKRLLAVHFLVVLKARLALLIPRVTIAALVIPTLPTDGWSGRFMALKDISTSTRIRIFSHLDQFHVSEGHSLLKMGLEEISLPLSFCL